MATSTPSHSTLCGRTFASTHRFIEMTFSSSSVLSAEDFYLPSPDMSGRRQIICLILIPLNQENGPSFIDSFVG